MEGNEEWVHSLISRLEKTHGKATGGMDRVALGETEHIVFADGTKLSVFEFFDERTEQVRRDSDGEPLFEVEWAGLGVSETEAKPALGAAA
jgi:hypothetical protein